MENITEWILGLAISALALLVKAKMNSNDHEHEKHFEAIADLKERTAALEARIDVLTSRNGWSR